MATFDLKNKACIVGVGTSEKFGFVLDKSPLTLHIESFKAALEDAGLRREDIDGFHTAHGAPIGVDYDEFAALAGCNFRWVNQNWTHGRWVATAVAHAALAVCMGLCNYAAIMNTFVSRRGYGRFRSHGGGEGGEGLRDVGGGHGEVSIHGFDTPGAATALAAKKYMDKYDATSEELATTALTFRKHACLNPMAIMYGKPMTLEDYMSSRVIVPPFHLFDYCLVNEGSTCIIVTTAERARNLKKAPVNIAGLQGVPTGRNSYHLFSRPGLGTAFEEEVEYRAPQHLAYQMAGVSQKDVDALYMYDSFSSNLWMVLERFGFCPSGEAHTWVQGGRIELGGELPVNTNGGNMSEGDFTGYSHIIEMARQLRRECGERQVKGAELLQWATPWGDSVILSRG